MDAFDDFERLTEGVPLFPLPDLVLFPFTSRSLHIFEPRYRIMTKDALEGTRYIALANLIGDWQPVYFAKPDIHPTVCVAKIVTFDEFEDGRFNLEVKGVVRARIESEWEVSGYRVADLSVMHDHIPPVEREMAREEMERTIQLLKETASPELCQSLFKEIEESDDDLNRIAFSYRLADFLKLDTALKLRLRDTNSTLERFAVINGMLEELAKVLSWGPGENKDDQLDVSLN